MCAKYVYLDMLYWTILSYQSNLKMMLTETLRQTEQKYVNAKLKHFSSVWSQVLHNIVYSIIYNFLYA